MELGRKYLANREFTKKIRFNKRDYILRSIFDTDMAEFDFDDTIAKYNTKYNIWQFDNTIQKYKNNNQRLFNKYKYFNNLYENKNIVKRK